MKKVIAVVFMLIGFAGISRADTVLNQIELAFVGNAKVGYEYTTHGKSIVEFLDNFVEIGHFKGGHVAAIDLGGQGTIDNDTGKFIGGNFTTGFKVHLAPFLRDQINLNPEWQFLNTIEVDGRASYNWTLHEPQYGLVLAYPFK